MTIEAKHIKARKYKKWFWWSKRIYYMKLVNLYKEEVENSIEDIQIERNRLKSDPKNTSIDWINDVPNVLKAKYGVEFFPTVKEINESLGIYNYY